MAVRYDDLEQATIYESRLINGSFFEFMELNKFPFDSQVKVQVYAYKEKFNIGTIKTDFPGIGLKQWKI
jgi:hypothetical protein